MRYKVKTDFTLGETLLLWAESLHLEEIKDFEPKRWKVFSFYLRKYVGEMNQAMVDHFLEIDKSSPCGRSPQEYRGKRRNTGSATGSLSFILLLLISSIGMAQKPSPMMWSTKAVQVEENNYEIHVSCSMGEGYYLLEPNRTDACIYSPSIVFTPSKEWTMTSELTTLRFTERHSKDKCPSLPDTRECKLAWYEGEVTFVITVRKNTVREKTPLILGKISYYPIANENSEGVIVSVFEIPLEFQGCINGNISTIKTTGMTRSERRKLRKIKLRKKKGILIRSGLESPHNIP